MATQIVKWKAADKSEWDSEAFALERDALCAVVDEAMSPLPKLSRYLRSDEFFQHDPSTVINCRVAILKLCAKQFPNYEVFRHEPPEEVHPRSVAGRILDDIGGPLDTAWRRFGRIDDQGREWEQVYFVANPPADAQQVQI